MRDSMGIRPSACSGLTAAAKNRPPAAPITLCLLAGPSYTAGFTDAPRPIA